MFHDLKDLRRKQMLSIDNEIALDLTGRQDFSVRGIKVLSQEEGEICLIDLDGYYLISHTFHGDPVYGLYELIKEEESEDDEFPSKIRIPGRKETIYRATMSEVTNLSVDYASPSVTADEIAYCEYANKAKAILLLEKLDALVNTYQGLRISEDAILL